MEVGNENHESGFDRLRSSAWSEPETIQLLFRDLSSRPGGPWAWYEPDKARERGLPSSTLMKIFFLCDVRSLALAETVCKIWRDHLSSVESSAIWQAAFSQWLQSDLVFESSRLRIDSYKAALGMKTGQSAEQERLELQPRNWKRIVRMHRATQRLPFYTTSPSVVELRDHAGPILCMCKIGPYLFTGGADHRLLQYRIASLQIYTPEKWAQHRRPPPPPSRSGKAHTPTPPCAKENARCSASRLP